MDGVTKKLIPPDGGWGWVIVLAYATNMICTIPVIQGFGLVFRNRCADLGMTATEISIIINVNSAFGMGLGLINGPLIRRFGCRRVALLGSVFHTAGLTLSAWANSFTYFVITYGILCSLGTSIMNSAFSLALNSYFLKKRARAVGLAMTLTGLGPILAPQLMSFLMSQYGVTGTAAVLGAISFHTWAAALLLQPIAWHLKEDVEVPDVEVTSKLVEDSPEDEKTRKEYVSTSCEDLKEFRRKKISIASSDVDTENVYGFETLAPRKRSVCYTPVDSEAARLYRRSRSQSETVPPIYTSTEPTKPSYRWWESALSLETINLGSSIKIFDESRSNKRSKSRENFGNDDERKPGDAQALMHKTIVQTVEEEEEDGEDDKEHHRQQEKEEPKKNKSAIQNALEAVVVFFDFDLLRDPIYVNLMLGMSIAIFAEMNFAVLTPFILSDMSFNDDQIATVLSCLAMTDLAMRGVSPFIGEWVNQPPRVMYLFSLILLVATRSGLLCAENFTPVLFVGFALGVAKGIRSVYMTMVIASHVPIQKLASATGIQMATNGIILMSLGPILGVIRDRSGSYNLCIVSINVLTTLTIIMWTIEIIIRKFKGKSSNAAEISAQEEGRGRKK